MIKKSIYWAALVIFLLGSSCRQSPTTPSIPAGEDSVFDENFELHTSANWVNPQTINFHIDMKNKTDKKIDLYFGDTEHYDIRIFNSSGRLVWNSSYGYYFLMVVNHMTFNAGETVFFNAEWKLTANGGQPVPRNQVYIVVVNIKCDPKATTSFLLTL